MLIRPNFTAKSRKIDLISSRKKPPKALTVAAHPERHAFFEATVLTTVTIGPVNDTRATARALVPGIVLLGATEETLAPFACNDAIVNAA